MKITLIAGIAFIASCSAALAADAQAVVTPGPFSPPPAYPVARVYDWTGFYVGINGGAAFGTTNWFSVPNIIGGNAKLTGGLVGGTAGYNLQTGEPYVLGIEADLDWTGLKATTASTACAPNPVCELNAPVLGTVRLRFGYAFDTILPYVTGGAAIANLSADIVGAPFGTATATNLGWAAGAGVEFAISNALRAKVEYLHTDVNGFSCNAACGGGPVSFNVNSNVIRASLNYRLWMY